MPRERLTIQYISGDTWEVMIGHGCETEAEMHEYVATLGRGVRVADADQAGEAVDPVLYPREPSVTERLDAIWDKADDAGKERLRFAILEIVKALKS